MIIPDPKLVPVNNDLHGKLFWQRFNILKDTPPRFRLTEDWLVTLDDGTQTVVPHNFETDFASTPRWFWALPGFSPSGPLLWGAILHDFGYQYGYLLAIRTCGVSYPEASHCLRERFPAKFAGLMPVAVGYRQEYFDDLLRQVTIEKTGAEFVASAAHKVLGWFGGTVWGKYRRKGPAAYNTNSLGLPGVTLFGVKF